MLGVLQATDASLARGEGEGWNLGKQAEPCTQRPTREILGILVDQCDGIRPKGKTTVEAGTVHVSIFLSSDVEDPQQPFSTPWLSWSLHRPRPSSRICR